MMLLQICAWSSFAIIITAAIVGNPSIKCETDRVLINIVTDQPFKGHLFVRGHFGQQKCHKDYRKLSEKLISTNFSFDSCGMRRKRQTHPRGVTVTSTLILTYHPTFITANDKAFNIECFFKEGNRAVYTNVKVSPLKAANVLMQPSPPICVYSVLNNASNGKPVMALKLGDLTYHYWDCGKEQYKIYCMRLHSCIADNGGGISYQIIDSNGCSVDETIFPQIEYTSDMTAGVLVRAFKFADRSKIFFQCQVGISLKANYESGKCDRPVCTLRKRRSAQVNEKVLHLFSQQLSVSDAAVNGTERRHSEITNIELQSPGRHGLILQQFRTTALVVSLCIVFAILLTLLFSRLIG